MSEQDIRRLNYKQQPDTSQQIIRNGDSYNLDTREQLEADVASILRNAASHTSINTSIGDTLRYTVPGSGAAPWQTAEDACEALASIAERQIAELTAELETYRKDADQGERVKPQLEENGDIRERLEADIANCCYPHSIVMQTNYDEVCSWLNRQAAITEREVKERVDFSLITQTANALFPDYQERIDELTAERDELQAENKRLRDSEACVGCEVIGGQMEELTAERDELRERLDAMKAVVDKWSMGVCGIEPPEQPVDNEQADSREKLEADLENMVRSWCADNTSVKATRGVIMYWQVKELLDRQAAITERELCSRCSPYATAKDYLDTIDSLTAERDALKAKLETYGKVPDQDECKKQQPMESGDTREQLEADISKWWEEEWLRDLYNNKDMVRVVGRWLDRQAAITEREVKERVNFSLITQTANALFPDYQERIDELTAERDQLSRDLTAEHALVTQFEYDNERLREAIDAMGCGQFYSMYKAKCEECEQLKKVARTQADSFKKLEIELGKQ